MTRSGWRTASRSAIAAPIEMPPTTNRSRPRRSAKASTSSAKVAIEQVAGCRPTSGPGRGIPASAGEMPAPSGKISATCASSPPSPCWKTTGRPAPLVAAMQERQPSRCSVSQLTTLPPRRSARRRKAATAGASASVSPCVTSGPSKPAPRRRAHEMAEVDDAGAGGGEAAVGAPVLGMRHDDAVAEQVDRLRRRSRALSSGGGRLEQIGRIEHDPDARRADARRSAAAPARPTTRHWPVPARCRGRRRTASASDDGLDHLDEQVVPGLRVRHCPDDAPTGRSGRGCRCTA